MWKTSHKMEYITTVSLVSLLITKITYCRRQSVCTERSFFFKLLKKSMLQHVEKAGRGTARDLPFWNKREVVVCTQLGIVVRINKIRLVNSTYQETVSLSFRLRIDIQLAWLFDKEETTSLILFTLCNNQFWTQGFCTQVASAISGKFFVWMRTLSSLCWYFFSNINSTWPLPIP